MTPALDAAADVGCVVAVQGGVVEVLTDTGRRTASLGGALLARIAADPGARPEPGDWVRLTRWPDGPVTVDRALRRVRDAVVVPLRRPHR